jgi:pimeloyl-ACP methyl ester carboxylesterase
MSKIAAITLSVLLWLLLPAELSASASLRTGTLAVHGVSLYWEEHGDPDHPPLMLLHGFGESMSVWQPYLPALTAQYNVVLLDLRGHGHSTNPSNAFTFTAAADDVLALMDHLHHPRFRAVGVSAGGITLLHVATRNPLILEGLVLVGTAPYLPSEARARIKAITQDKDAIEYFRRFSARGDEQAASLLRQFSALATSVGDPAFTPPQLAAIKAPTLIVHGDRDEFFPLELALELYRSIPTSYLKIYPNGGHEPIYEPAAVSEFSDLPLQFFAGAWKHN